MANQFIAFLLALILPALISGCSVVENYCNDNATRGQWTVGIKDQRVITSIVNEISPEHRKVVEFLDKLPIKISESSIYAGVPSKPKDVTRLFGKHVRTQWEIPGKESNLSIIVQHHKGCISQISLMDSRSLNFYNLTNRLPTKP